MITGDEEKALAILKSAIQAVPNCVELLTKLGEMHLRRNEYTQAQEVLASAYNSSSILPKVTSLYAEALTHVGQVETVEQILQPALVEFPEDLNLIFIYAKTLLVLNKPEQAIPYLESVLDSPRMDQEDPSITYAQALLAANVNEEGPRFLPSKAIRPLEKVIAKNPANLHARAYLAEILTASQQFDEALDAFQEIFETELINDPIWSTKLSTGMARAALALGKPEVAIAALQDVVKDHPTTSNPYRLLAEAYLEACLYENSLLAAQSAMSYLEIDTTTTPWLVEFFKSFLSKHNTDGLKPTNSNLLDQVLKNSIETVKTIIQTQPNQIGLAISL
jgi:cytochrome c-type biogenesis protein CcmH/NrfG